MSALGNLVRISRWQLDEKRQKLADLERLQDKLKGDLARLDDNLETERVFAETSDEARRAFPAFAAAERGRRQRLCQSLEKVGRQIEQAREEVRDVFREAKKYELAQANEQDRDRRRRSRAEDAAMDEVGSQLHRRKRKTGR